MMNKRQPRCTRSGSSVSFIPVAFYSSFIIDHSSFVFRYFLPRPAVEAGQLGQRRRRAERVMVEGGAAGADDVEKGQFAGQKASHRRLVGRVQHRAARAAPGGDLVPQL